MKGVFTGTRGILWGPESNVQRCLATTRRGAACMRPSEVNPLTGKRSRYRFHGGLGWCRADEGKARISAANTKHGRYTKAAIGKRKAELAAKRATLAAQRAELDYLNAECMQLKRELVLESRKQRFDDPGYNRIVYPAHDDPANSRD
jgi:hypothetical protein